MQEFLNELSKLCSEIYSTLSWELRQLDAQTQVVISVGLVLLVLFLIFAETKPKAAPPPTQGNICISVAADKGEELDGLLSAEIEKQKAVLAVADKEVCGVEIGDKAEENGIWKQEAHVCWKNK